MRRGWAAAAVVILAAACGSAAGAPTRGGGSCGPSRAKTLAEDSKARIYAVGTSVYGCADGHRQAYLLGHAPQARPGQDRVSELTLGGVYAGYAVSQMGVDTVSAEVAVRRLDSGQTVHDVNAMTKPLGPEFFETVEAVVVKADGAVAWIATGGSIVHHGRAVEVNRLDRRGEAPLDTGSGIDTHSLRLTGSRLSWRDGGAARTSTLL